MFLHNKVVALKGFLCGRRSTRLNYVTFVFSVFLFYTFSSASILAYITWYNTSLLIYLTVTIPLGLGNLNNLLVLRLRANNVFGTIPSNIGKLKRLVSLDLEYKMLNGPIPYSLGY